MTAQVLLDTHALVWWLEGRKQLSAKARQVMEDADMTILVSAASAWELAIKTQIGKFKSPEFVHGFESTIQKEGFVELRISIEHALCAGGWDSPHKDPFDRILAAQAKVENVPILSNDKLLDQFSVRRLW